MGLRQIAKACYERGTEFGCVDCMNTSAVNVIRTPYKKTRRMLIAPTLSSESLLKDCNDPEFHAFLVDLLDGQKSTWKKQLEIYVRNGIDRNVEEEVRSDAIIPFLRGKEDASFQGADKYLIQPYREESTKQYALWV